MVITRVEPLCCCATSHTMQRHQDSITFSSSSSSSPSSSSSHVLSSSSFHPRHRLCDSNPPPAPTAHTIPTTLLTVAPAPSYPSRHHTPSYLTRIYHFFFHLSIYLSHFGIDPNFRPRTKLRYTSPPFLRLAHRFFHLTTIQAIGTGAILFILLCIIPQCARTYVPTSLPSLSDSIRKQRGWTPDEGTWHHDGRPTIDEIKTIYKEEHEFSLKHDGRTYDPIDDTSLNFQSVFFHLFLSSSGAASIHQQHPLEWTFTTPRFNPFTLGYQRVTPLKVGKMWSIDLNEVDKSASATDRGDAADRLNPALSHIDWHTGPPLPEVASSPESLARSSFEFRHNRFYTSESQETLKAFTPLEEVRRFRLVRDYKRFPSDIPNFLSIEPLQVFSSSTPTSLSPVGESSDRTIHVPPEEDHFPTSERILLLYVFSYNHDEYLVNFESFIRDCVREDEKIDYIFILNEMVGRELREERLPKLPKNARYIRHKNECYDWGTIGWFLDLQHDLYMDSHVSDGGGTYPSDPSNSKYRIDMDRYKYFILMNSSVRGPYFPSYIDLDDRRNRWWLPFMYLMRRDKMIKMVGPLINCQFSPHVQSYVILLDQEGMALLRGRTGSQNGGGGGGGDTSTSTSTSLLNRFWTPAATHHAYDRPHSSVFQCHSSWGDAVDLAEIGSSFTIIRSGFNIGSLTRAYSGVDFRSSKTQDCFGMENNPSQMTFIGSLITSGPDDGHTQQQISYLIQHQQRWYDEVHQRLEEHDLEGDVLTEKELKQQQQFYQQLDKLKSVSEYESYGADEDERSDWDWTEEHRPGQRHHALRSPRTDMDLTMQLRILERAKSAQMAMAVKRVLEERSRTSTLASPIATSSSKVDADGVIMPPADIEPLLPAPLQSHRSRPDLLNFHSKQSSSSSSSSPHSNDDDLLDTIPLTKLVDLKLLKDVARELLEEEQMMVTKVKEDIDVDPTIDTKRPLDESPIPKPFQTSEPLSPTLMVERARHANRLVGLQSLSIDPLEVLFGKWKYGLQMEHLYSYEQWRLAAHRRRIEQHHQRVRREYDEWQEKNHHRWRRGWSELEKEQLEHIRLIEERKDREIQQQQEDEVIEPIKIAS